MERKLDLEECKIVMLDLNTITDPNRRMFMHQQQLRMMAKQAQQRGKESQNTSGSFDMSRATCACEGGRAVARSSSYIELKIPSQRLKMEEVPRNRQPHLLTFTAAEPCAFDTEVNVVADREIEKYAERFDIPKAVVPFLSDQRAVWNPPRGAVAIYGTMLTSGVTLPLQPFISRFLAAAGIAPAQLAPNSYRTLFSLWHLWKLIGAKEPPTPQEIRNFYTLGRSDNGGTFYLQFTSSSHWIPREFAERVPPPFSKDHKGLIWGFPSLKKYWKNSWFFVRGDWGETVAADPHQNLNKDRVPRHFCSPEVWNKTPAGLTKDQAKNVVQAAQKSWESRDCRELFVESNLIRLGLFMTLSRHRRRLYGVDVVVGDQAKKAKGVDRVSQKEAAAQLAQGIAHLDQDPVEHVYEPDLNVSSEPSVQGQEDSPAHPRDPKRKPSRGTSTGRVAKETAGRKVVKTVAGSSAPEAFRAQKAVTIEVGPEAHNVRVMVEDLDEEGEDHRSKSKSDRPAAVHTPLSFDLVQCRDQDPRPFSVAMAQATQIPTQALFDLSVKPLANPPTKLTVSRQLVLTDSDEEANNKDVPPKCPVDQVDKIPMGSSRRPPLIEGDVTQVGGVEVPLLGEVVATVSPVGSTSASMLHVDLTRLDQIAPRSRGQRGTSSPISRSARGRTNLSQHQTPIPSRAHSESGVPSSSRRSSVDPLDMLQCMSAGKAYVGEGYWNDSRVPSSSERIRTVFNNGVYAVEELTRALISQERQASEISRLRRELAEKNDVLKSASVSESKIKQGFEERLKQWEVTEDALRKTLAIAENKAFAATESLKELSLRNSQLEASIANAELRSAELESRAILAEQEAAKSVGVAKTAKESLAAAQCLILESQRKAEEAKLHFEKLTEELSNQQVSREMLSEKAQLAREIQVVDRYKRSPAFDAVMLRELERGLSTAQVFFDSRERSTEDARRRWDRVITKHKANSLEAIKNQRIRWRAYCRSIGKEPHAMHLELPSISSLVTFHADDKVTPSGEMVDIGPLPDADYSLFMTDDIDEISWPDFGDLSKGYGDGPPGTSDPGGPSDTSQG